MPRSHSSPFDPSGPPPEVLDAVDAAWERAQAGFDEELDLHFEADDVLHRAWGELRDAEGVLQRRLSASEALAICCGDAAASAPALAV
jgi:hypothetical protein